VTKRARDNSAGSKQARPSITSTLLELKGAFMDTPAPYQPYETAAEEAVDIIRIYANELRGHAKMMQRPDNFFAVANEMDRAAELLQEETQY
jgi:hypothetical protein